MGDHATALDMTIMYAVHDALRREVTRIARVSSGTTDDPVRILRTAVGWEMFKKYLHVHHTSEDATVWPVMREKLAGRADDLELLDAMEAEHVAIDPLLDQIDAAIADPNGGHLVLGGMVDELVTTLGGHLAHEEDDALALIDATMTLEQWQRFGDDHRARIGDDAPRYLPWVLDNAKPERARLILSKMPEHLQQAYRETWLENYSTLDLWGVNEQR